MTPAPAFASDYRGFISAMVVLCFVAPFALLNLMIPFVLALRGGCLKEKNALRHSMIAARGPATGFLAMAYDEFERDTAIMFLVANGVAPLPAAIPLVAHNRQEHNAQDQALPLP